MVQVYLDKLKVAQLVKKFPLNPKVYYCVHKSPPLDLILNQLNSVHIFVSHSFKINFDILLPAKPDSFN